MMIPLLPDDVALDCLYRVPVAEHATLRQVCAGWRAVVESRAFGEARRRLGYAQDYVCFLAQEAGQSDEKKAATAAAAAARSAAVDAEAAASDAGDDDEGKESSEERRMKAAEEARGAVVRYGMSIYDCGGGGGWMSCRLATAPLFAQLLLGNKREQQQQQQREEEERRRGMKEIEMALMSQCASVGGKVVVMGGFDPRTWELRRAVHVYDVAARVWRRGADMPRPRAFFGVAASAGSGSAAVVVAAGGHDGDKAALRTADAYDVAADTWRALPDMAAERDECRAAALPDGSGRVLVVSGYGTGAQGRFRRSAELYDPARPASWRLVRGLWMAGARAPASLAAAAAVTQGDLVLYAVRDGKLWKLKLEDYYWEEDQEEEEEEEEEEGVVVGARTRTRARARRPRPWTLVASLPPDLEDATCATVLRRSGHVVVAGFGRPPLRPPSAWRFSPSSSSWTLLPDVAGVVHAACTIHV